MADPDDARGSLASTFPDPPAYFWTDFTLENVARVKELRTAYAARSGETLSFASRIPHIPGHLLHLQPPTEPEEGRWRLQGAQYTVR